MNEEKLLKEIQSLYLTLNKVVMPLYKFNNCPKCDGDVMNILRIPPTGDLIEYSCESCGEVIKGSIIAGENPDEALNLQNNIKSKLHELVSLIGDEVHKREIDIAFSINRP